MSLASAFSFLTFPYFVFRFFLHMPRSYQSYLPLPPFFFPYASANFLFSSCFCTYLVIFPFTLCFYLFFLSSPASFFFLFLLSLSIFLPFSFFSRIFSLSLSLVGRRIVAPSCLPFASPCLGSYAYFLARFPPFFAMWGLS